MHYKKSNLGIAFILIYIAIVILFMINFKAHCFGGDSLCQLGIIIPFIPQMLLTALPPFSYLGFGFRIIVGTPLCFALFYFIGYGIEKLYAKITSKESSIIKTIFSTFVFPIFIVLCIFALYFFILSFLKA